MAEGDKMSGRMTKGERTYYHGRVAFACALLTGLFAIASLWWWALLLPAVGMALLTGYHSGRAVFGI